MRKDAREKLYQFVYANQISGDWNEGLKSMLAKEGKLTQDDLDYFDRVLSIITEHVSELEKIIDEKSTSFPGARIFPSDKSILLIGLAEILYCDDIPSKVTLNEAANVASKYSTEKSASYVSGILSAVAGENNV